MRLAIIGQMQSGKDTAAEYLSQKALQHAEASRVLKFADPLYAIQKEIYRITGLEEPTRDRQLLQWIGTDWGRSKDPDIWLKVFRQQLQRVGRYHHIFCTDCRFQNELELLKEEGFRTLKVIRPGHDGDGHESERFAREWTDADHTIHNNGTLEEFHAKLDLLWTVERSPR